MSAHRKAANRTQKKIIRRPRPPYDPTSAIVRGFDLRLAIGISQTTIWRLRRAGKFPPHVQLGENAVGWRRSDLEAWIAHRRAPRV